MRALLAIAMAGCWAPQYEPGTLEGETHPRGCLDVSVRGAWPHEADGPVVVIGLGNRCEHSVAVDLTALHVVGGDDVGASVPMTPYDPAHEISARRIDARREGYEWIEVHGPILEPLWLDVDIGRIVDGRGLPPTVRTPEWECGYVDARAAEQWIRITVPRREAS